MATTTQEQVFKRHQKVVAAEDLPFVPAGTRGKVLYVAGVTWIRYHVRFENGRFVSSVDARALATPDDWADRRDAAERATREAAAKEVPA